MDDDHNRDDNGKKHITHHELFRDLFAMMGSRFATEKELDGQFFTNPTLIPVSFDIKLVIEKIKQNYSASVGGFCLFEEISYDWVKALHDGLAVHFPEVSQHPYFKECLTVECIHGSKALELANSLYDLHDRSSNPFMQTEMGETELSTIAHANDMGAIMDMWMSALQYRLDEYNGKTVEAYDDLIAVCGDDSTEIIEKNINSRMQHPTDKQVSAWVDANYNRGVPDAKLLDPNASYGVEPYIRDITYRLHSKYPFFKESQELNRAYWNYISCLETEPTFEELEKWVRIYLPK
jgi:hypothetical protein